MKFINSNWKIISRVFIAISALALLVSVVGVYFYNFSNEFSSKNSDWGNFGDYIGGMITPILSFATIIILLYENRIQRQQFEEEKDKLEEQVELQQKQLNYHVYEENISMCIKELNNIQEKIIPANHIQDMFEFVFNTKDIMYDKNEKHTIIFCNDKEKMKSFPDSSVFGYYEVISKNLSFDKMKDFIRTNSLFSVSFRNFMVHFEQLFFNTVSLHALGYPKRMLLYYLGLFIYRYKSIYKFFPKANNTLINYITTFIELPEDNQNEFLDFSFYKVTKKGVLFELSYTFPDYDFSDEKKLNIKNSFVNEDYTLVIDVEYDKKAFRKKNFQWQEVDITKK